MPERESLDRTLEAFKNLAPYMRGALWWVRNDLLKARQETFNQDDDHIGHPALSVRCRPLRSRYEPIPMLMGTSARSFSSELKSECVKVVNLTEEDPKHASYFGTIVEPGLYTFEDLLDGISAKKEITASRQPQGKVPGVLRKEPWYKVRTMVPNGHKPMVDVDERTALNNFCMKHGI